MNDAPQNETQPKPITWEILDKFEIPESANLTALAEVVIFEHDNFQGLSQRTNIGLSFPQDSFWNDSISSIMVISGRWRFCVKNDGNTAEGFVDLGVGRYANAGAFRLPNDSISSFYVLSDS